MSERKNIDRLFQERFKDFESEPSEQAWKNIEARLEEKKDRKLIPFWFKYAGVAAVLLIGLLLTLDYGNDPKVNGGTQVVTAPDKNAKAKDNDAKKPTDIGNENFGKPNNAVTTNDAIDPKANKAGKAESPSKANGANTDPMLNPNGSNASGIPQKDAGIATYPSKKASNRNASDSERKSGITKKTLPSVEESREQYASAASKNRKSKKGHNAKSNKTELQYAGENNNANESQIAASNGKPAKNAKTNDNLKNENQIAVNENNQSGQPEQHNEKEVTAKTTTSTQDIAAKTGDIKKDSTALAMAEEPNALEKLQNEKENKSVTENEPKMNRWQVSPRVAPIYLSSTSSGSPIDSRFAKNDKDYKTQLSYGVGVGYALNKRLSVRAGVNSLSFEYNTNNVVAMQSTVGRQQLEHVKPTLQGAFLRIENKDPNAPVEFTSNGLVAKEFSSSLSQKTGYIEVPVELSYKLIDKRFGIDVIGGFSTLFLNENEVSVVSSDNEIQVGKADNLNATSFSTNIGLGLRYNIWKALQFNVEPMFKYQINTYSESGNFKPYFFGLYTGLNYRF